MKYEARKQLQASELSARHKEFAQTRVRPNNNAEYFAAMTKAISRAGLNWKVIENKWSGFLTAFEGFDIDRVAQYNDEDVDRLMCDKGIVRNRQKILAIIRNAQELQKIVRQHESIASYLNSLTKSGEEGAITTLSERFAHLGPATAAIFLWLVGFYLPDRASYMINKYGPDPD